jgi:hypothetical protein
VAVSKVRNPPSTRRSSEFVAIYHATSAEQKVAAYTSQEEVIKGQAPVYMANDKPAALQGLSRESITLVDDDYSAVTEYAITFTPYSWPKTNPTTLQHSYPATVEPSPADGSGGCSTSGGGTVFAQGAKCTKTKGARLLAVADAIKPGYSGPVTIKIKFKNPENNWGRVGFKLKTYELVVDPTTKAKTEYLMNVVEGNELIPILKCLSPCEDCKQPPAGELVNYKMYKSYCTKCWQDTKTTTSPLKYLHQKPYRKQVGGKAVPLTNLQRASPPDLWPELLKTPALLLNKAYEDN